MHIEYICHSCLYFNTGDIKIVIDPWIKGPAYQKQWYLFPQPTNTAMLSAVDYIFYSHGHEDHLHEESLQDLPQKAHVFYPYQWRTGVKDFFIERGFLKLTEAVSFRSYKLSESTYVTYIGFALESVIVIEHNDLVIVNINDALNSHHQNVVDMFLNEIKIRWPKIDILFSGWSGAGYFPNKVHYKGKDDFAVGKIREQYFGNHLCKIIKYLQPASVAPFAPGFVLLAKDNQWINDVKFPRGMFEEYYRKNFDADSTIIFNILYPSDYFEDSTFYNRSLYYRQLQNGSLNHLIPELYKNEIAEANVICWGDDASVQLLIEKLTYYINKNKTIYNNVVLHEVNFAIRLKNMEGVNFINVYYAGNRFNVRRDNAPLHGCLLIIETTTHLLHYSMDSEWGGDALTIGYGADIYVLDDDVLEKNLDIVSVRLITRYPRASSQLKKNPLRAIKYYTANPMLGRLAIMQKLKLKSHINKFPFNERDHWISFTKCELCQVCNMPLLSFDFAEVLA